MLSDERIVSFISSLEPSRSMVLNQIEQEAIDNMVPIVRKDMQALLRFLVRTRRPERILEVGTAVGFSALLMWEAAEKAVKITTIENYDKRIKVARENFDKAGASQDITLLEGDAFEVLDSVEGTYRFIFMDAAKGQYPAYLPKVTRLLEKGGILITDNVLQDGDVCESRFAVTRRNRTIHGRMREYLYELTHSEDFETVIMNVGDGVAISYKK